MSVGDLGNSLKYLNMAILLIFYITDFVICNYEPEPLKLRVQKVYTRNEDVPP
jgi:hypothetical protein